MEDNKYYTPDISEFHIGFEYEFQDKRGRWEKFILDESDTLADRDGFHDDWNPFAYYKSSKERFRIKYLDKEDIQAEGFALYSENETKIIFRERFDKKFITVDWLKDSGLICIHSGYTLQSHTVYFYGKIKNRSELKRILKMIGV